jgi:hypothetical protein
VCIRHIYMLERNSAAMARVSGCNCSCHENVTASLYLSSDALLTVTGRRLKLSVHLRVEHCTMRNSAVRVHCKVDAICRCRNAEG